MNSDGIDPENDDGKVHFSIQAAKKMWLGILVNTTHPKSAIKKKKTVFKISNWILFQPFLLTNTIISS